MNDVLKEDYNQMRLALYKCIEIFNRSKKKYIDKKDYDRAAKMREYEKLCKDAIQPKLQKDFLCMIITQKGITTTIDAQSYFSKCGLIDLAIMKLKQDKQVMFDKCNRLEEKSNE